MLFEMYGVSRCSSFGSTIVCCTSRGTTAPSPTATSQVTTRIPSQRICSIRRLATQDDRREHRYDGKQIVERPHDRDVGEPRAVSEASLRVLQIKVREEVPEAEQDQKQRRQHEEVPSGLRRSLQLVEPVQTAHAEIDQSDRDKRHQDCRQRRSVRDLQRGKPEDVEPGVHAEYGIGDAEAGPRKRKPPDHPLLRGKPASEQSQDDGQEPERPAQNSARREARASTRALASPQRQVPVRREKPADQQRGDDEGDGPRDVSRCQRRLVADAVEPPPLNPEPSPSAR